MNHYYIEITYNHNLSGPDGRAKVADALRKYEAECMLEWECQAVIQLYIDGETTGEAINNALAVCNHAIYTELGLKDDERPWINVFVENDWV